MTVVPGVEDVWATLARLVKSAPAIEISISLIAADDVAPGGKAVKRPDTSTVQKSWTLLPSRSLARKSASAVAMVFSEAEAFRSLEARWLCRRPGIAMAAMMAMIAITIISSISVKPFFSLIFYSPKSMKNASVPRIDGPEYRNPHASQAFR